MRCWRWHWGRDRWLPSLLAVAQLALTLPPMTGDWDTPLDGVQLITMGIIGSYIGRIFQEVKRRPLYLVREKHGFEPAREEAPEPVRLSAP